VAVTLAGLFVIRLVVGRQADLSAVGICTVRKASFRSSMTSLSVGTPHGCSGVE